MSAHMTVTPAQVAAAQLQLELAAELGEEVSPAVRAIAQAHRVAEPRTLKNGRTNGNAPTNGNGANVAESTVHQGALSRASVRRQRHTSVPGPKAVKAAKAPRGARTAPDSEQTTSIRDWARANGMAPTVRGRASAADPEHAAAAPSTSTNRDDTP